MSPKALMANVEAVIIDDPLAATASGMKIGADDDSNKTDDDISSRKSLKPRNFAPSLMPVVDPLENMYDDNFKPPQQPVVQGGFRLRLMQALDLDKSDDELLIVRRRKIVEMSKVDDLQPCGDGEPVREPKPKRKPETARKGDDGYNDDGEDSGDDLKLDNLALENFEEEEEEEADFATKNSKVY
ncbi:hypothetical protein HK101_001955 [Irineochytrium annulatum]|nr:hypothetical protein HK101_001955 [Irineochytrium annulatum]